MAIINQVVSGGGGSAPAHYIEKSVSNGKLVGGSSFIDLTGVTDLGNYVLYYAYYFNSNIGAVNMSSITHITGSEPLTCCFFGSTITSLNMSNLVSCSGSAYGICEACRSLTTVNLGSLIEIQNFGRAFTECPNLSSVDLHSATKIKDGEYMFYYCVSLTSIDLSNVTEILNAPYMFYTTGLTSMDLHNVTKISDANTGATADGMFSGCQFLTNLNLSGVEEISASNGASNLCNGCASLTSMTWTSLTTLGEQALLWAYSYSGIQTLYFPALTTFTAGVDPINNPDSDPFLSMLEGVDGCTVHFPAALQATIGNWPSVQAGFSGTNTTVLFDL